MATDWECRQEKLEDVYDVKEELGRYIIFNF